jgi:hypothetical protein
MAQLTYLVYKAQPQLGAQIFNGVVAALVNASSAANAKVNAALAANAGLVPSEAQSEAVQALDVYQSTYFDTAVAVSASAGVPASGSGSVNGDAYVFVERSAPVYVDHAAYTPVA